jgi:3-oxoacyl-[acyl-carrier protein] reductase
MDTIREKVAIVTGGSRGIGRAIAVKLASEGVLVAMTARSEAKLCEIQHEIEVSGGIAYGIVADLEDPGSAQSIVSQTVAQFGRLDILINNAGMATLSPLIDTTVEQWDRLMAVNARAPFLLCKAAIPHIKATGGGAIIQIVSVIGVKGYINQGAYTASKHALMGMSKVLAQEVKPDNIRVHTILPGGVDTEMLDQMRPDLQKSALMAPEEIADIVLFLLTHRGNAVIDDIHVRRASAEPWF